VEMVLLDCSFLIMLLLRRFFFEIQSRWLVLAWKSASISSLSRTCSSYPKNCTMHHKEYSMLKLINDVLSSAWDTWVPDDILEKSIRMK
jgi:hypothetical protein